ncbi:MAG: hypothetical protein HYR96_11050 [Deltaproteobacteria bacterium]|nr:hypothetical protein [Deltaproteobacteria bacterium]MBI3293979.1 hypothetical protein [Deltaproteobacteria bacterium]
MTHSSIKKAWWSSLLLSSCLLASQSSFQTRFEARGTYDGNGYQSHRHRLGFFQKYSTDHLQFEGSFRLQAEGLSVQDHSLVDLRDLFVGFKTGPVFLKAGWQQVVWGEAFGFYFADMVNSKDLSELGLGDLEANRLTIPLLNLKYIVSGSSLQLIYCPSPTLSRIAQPGSPFAFPFQSAFGALPVAVSTERVPPSWTHEFGARVTHALGATSLAAFYFNGLDRNPPFVSQLGPSVMITRPFYRMNSLGLSSSTDLGGSVLRSEFLFRPDQQYQVVAPASLSGSVSPTWIGVVGWDMPRETWQVGFQVSTSVRTLSLANAGADTKEQLSIRVAGTLTSQIEWELISSYLPHDGSGLLQPKILFPLSPHLEISLAGDLFLGGESSDFGRFTHASRIVGEFRAHIGSL